MFEGIIGNEEIKESLKKSVMRKQNFTQLSIYRNCWYWKKTNCQRICKNVIMFK